MKVWTILVAMISTAVLADQRATAPVAPAAAKPAAASELRTVPLVPGPAVVSANRVNVRGKAGLIGEVIGRLTNGEPVTVIEEVILKNSKPNEPSAWAKIALPPGMRVWVHGSFIDRTAMTVKATKLNLRSGPGENYGILGSLQKGDSVREIETKGDWMQIEPPSSAFAFVAAQYLKQEAPAIVAETTPTEPAPEAVPSTVTDTPGIAPTTEVEGGAMNETPAVEPTAEATPPGVVTERIIIEEPAPPRIVMREGLVRSTLSIQAPTKFELVSPDNFRPINFLYTTSTNLDLSRYKGLHIIVAGEEAIDERWRNTPVLTIQRIQVLE